MRYPIYRVILPSDLFNVLRRIFYRYERRGLVYEQDI